ncbi:torsin-2A precursor [Xenopus laevis]|uniref:Torsin-2A n=1 Tax=Xenopus laevis TaxID=8355 RepID=TOR2A_XENLA|nr:torsin-2A precursor [Xenopus laevis]Q68F68.1 RecName: Full=Torsin-2A; AltName: Full=Torsin family 2 member A; Flags: Precursor [Xenopus laevis]AAH79976.1 Tor2a protein [Xenopus laevis]
MAVRWWIIPMLLLVPGSSGAWEVLSLPFSLYNFYECGFKVDIEALDCDLARNVFGQHLAQELLFKSVKEFIESDNPSKPLVLSLHGWSGTGKTFVSSLLVKHLFKEGSQSRFVHFFSPVLHFPRVQNLEQYKVDLKGWIQGNLTACGRSLFVFEEMDKMHPGLIDAIVPFLGTSWVVYGSNYRKAIFLFISNAGGDDINEVALDFWRQRKDREDIRLHHLESAISKAVFSNPKHGFWQSQIINQHLIDVIVPFLPLRPSHVRQCVRTEMVQQGLEPEEVLVNNITDSFVYFPEDEKVFSSTGCKTVASRINYFV